MYIMYKWEGYCFPPICTFRKAIKIFKVNGTYTKGGPKI